MRHPLVTLITHPTNRLVPHRPRLRPRLRPAVRSRRRDRTVVEIDGAPSHLDLDGALARRAIAAGATVAIDSDCHRAEMLDRQMQLGIMTARRGWVEPRHVAQHAAARRGPRVHRRQARRALTAPSRRSTRPPVRARRRSSRRRLRALPRDAAARRSTSATPDRSRRRSARRSSRRATAIRCISRSAARSSGSSRGEPAHALNLASAVAGGDRLRPDRARRRRAVGIGRRRGRPPRCSSPASYTFWSQAVIAEVYALHIALVALTLLLLLRWEQRPTIGAAGAVLRRLRARRSAITCR